MTGICLGVRETLHRLSRREAADDEQGQGMVEYALILVLIAVVVILVVSTVGKDVSNVFSNVSKGLGN